VKTWTEYAVRVVTGSGEVIHHQIDGPEPEQVAQYARRRADDGSNRMVAAMDALRTRTVRATEWRHA